jgi:hypothetical protein
VALLISDKIDLRTKIIIGQKLLYNDKESNQSSEGITTPKIMNKR